MDIHSAASRLSSIFHVGDRELEIGEHGIIGDGHTCALMGVDGSVEWLCMPRFDSPSLFARLLDAEHGGTFRISPARRPLESLQAYDGETNVLQTLFRGEGGSAVILTDSMPWIDDPRLSVHELHRQIEARGGNFHMEIVFDPRFDYGRAKTQIEITQHGLLASSDGGERATLSVGTRVIWQPLPGGGMRGEFTARPGEHTWAIFSYRAPAPEAVGAYRPFDMLRRTRRLWRSWSSQLRYDGPWRHEVMRSALTLKLLQYGPSGAVVAAATTSLPEGASGARNWDYRFSWTRDSAMAIRAMSLLGYQAEARGFFHFVRDTLDSRRHLDLMVTVDGGDVPEEHEVQRLRGHRGLGPVRIGNAASGQLQLDVAGWLLDAAYLHERSGGVVPLRLWRHIRSIVEGTIAAARQPDHGLWEPRCDPMHRVHSKTMAWVALDRGARLGPRVGDRRAAQRWRRAARDLYREILERGLDASTGSFSATYGGHSVDASLLLIPLYGLLPSSDPRCLNTVERVRRELSEGHFLRRYRDRDGIDGAEGAFVLCGFWLCEALALAGRLDEAIEVFTHQLRASNHLGLLAEEVAPASGAPLGNFPQAFSHLGLIHSAVRLHAGLRMRDEGVTPSQPTPFDPPNLP